MSTQVPPSTKDKLFKALYIVLFLFIGYIVWLLTVVIAIFQCIYDLALKHPNQNILEFGKSLNSYMYKIVSFLSYNSEEKPYPFGKWPGSDKI